MAALGAALGIEVTSAKSLAAAIAGGGALDLSIDDLHLLSSERSLDVLLTVAANLPPRSRLLLAGRTRPPDSLAAALNGGRTIELGREDLRMSESEAGALLRSTGIDLPGDELPGLVQRLEGWPTGLYLAALVLETDGRRPRRSTARTVMSLGTSTRNACPHSTAKTCAFSSGSRRSTSFPERCATPPCASPARRRG